MEKQTTRSNQHPIFVDGQKICEATRLSYSTEEPVEFHGSGLPGTPNVVERDPPTYTIEATLPTDDIYAPIDQNSRVEIGIPPSDHAGEGWKVVEVWHIKQFEITGSEFSLTAYQGRETVGVDYLGFDIDEVVDGSKLVEPQPGVDLRIDTKHEPTDEKSVVVESDEDSDFEADVHDI